MPERAQGNTALQSAFLRSTVLIKKTDNKVASTSGLKSAHTSRAARSILGSRDPRVVVRTSLGSASKDAAREGKDA
jgi:hypothetical protein